MAEESHGPSEPQAEPPPRSTTATALALFCAATVLFLAYRDLFVPGPRETEVWFGFEFHGRVARLTAPIHWAIFALFAYGFWKRHARVWKLAQIYAAMIAVSHLVWNLASPAGGGWTHGLSQLALFSLPILFLRAAEGSDRP